MVVPQEQLDKEDSTSNDIEALFGDSSDGDAVVPTMADEQVALLASFETAHREEGTRQFMVAEREALATMLVVRANAARKAARVVDCVAEASAELAAQEEAARAVARAGELAKEAATKAAAQEEMARDRHRWDEDMAAVRCAREIHELASQRRNVARRHAR
jgi:hypothetical protein